MLCDGLRFVQTLQRAVMALVQFPSANDRDPHQVHLVQHAPKGTDGAFQHRGVSHVEGDAGRLQQATRFPGLCAALFGQVDVRPTREQVFQVPGALPMSG